MYQGIVSIGVHQWEVSIAVSEAELAQGLSGLTGMSPGVGMFFDTGYQHVIQVTTADMLFNLDVVFMDSDFKVLSITSNLEPGELISSTSTARYFMEVNAGEAADAEVGDDVSVWVSYDTPATTGFDMSTMMNMVMMVMVMSMMMSMITGASGNTKAKLLQ